jgi:hypothetical protein
MKSLKGKDLLGKVFKTLRVATTAPKPNPTG